MQHITDSIQIGQLFYLNGTKNANEFLISYSNEGSNVGRTSKIVGLSNLSFFVAWESDPQHIYGQLFKADGSVSYLITCIANYMSVVQGKNTTLNISMMMFVDIHNSNASVIVYNLINASHCFFQLVSSAGINSSNFTQNDINNNDVMIINDDSIIKPSFSFQVSTPVTTTEVIYGNINFTITNCPNGFYLNENVCLICSARCKSCVGNNFSDCLSCDNKFYMEIYPGPSSCVSTCPDGFYGDNASSICETCNLTYHCNTCLGVNVSDCLSCVSGYYLQTNSAHSSCLSCYYTCSECSGPNFDQCLTCNSAMGRILYLNMCICESPLVDYGLQALCTGLIKNK